MFDTTADSEEALFWLGRTALRSGDDTVSVPDSAFDLDLLEDGAQVFWAADPDVPAAFLTNHEELFEDDDVLFAGSGQSEASHVTAIPELLLGPAGANAEAEDVAVFEPGTTVHFLTNPELLHADVCMAAPASVARKLFETRVGDV